MSAPETRPLLVADSACDLPSETLERLDIVGIPFPVITDGVEQLDDFGVTLKHGDFYARMRAGAAPTTTQIPLASYLAVFRRCVLTGRPVVYLALSSALSSTYETALLARDMVTAETPGRIITVIDSLSASTGLALLVHEAAREIERGLSHDELVDWVLDARTRIGAYFTLDQLETLRRGGRISDVAAVAGAMLDIKPLLRIDSEGQLVLADKVRGRRKSLKSLAQLVADRADGGEKPLVVIGNGDAGPDADLVREMVLEQNGEVEVVRTLTGPVIGSHTGPGMVSVVFWERRG